MPRLPVDQSEAARLAAAENLMQQYRACILLQTENDMLSPDATTCAAFASLGLPTAPEQNRTLTETMQVWLQRRIKLLLADLNPHLRPDAIACRNLLCFHFYNVESFLSNSQLVQRLPNIAALNRHWEKFTGNAIGKLPQLQVSIRKSQNQLDGVLPISGRTATNAIHAGLMLVFDIRRGSRRVSAAKPATVTSVATSNPQAQLTKSPLPKLDPSTISFDLKRQIHDEPTRVKVKGMMQRGFAWMAETSLGQNALVKAAKQNQNEWMLLKGYVIRCVQHMQQAPSADSLIRAIGSLALLTSQTEHEVENGFKMPQALSWLGDDAERLIQALVTSNLLIRRNDVLEFCSQCVAYLCLIPIWIELVTKGEQELRLPDGLSNDEGLLSHLFLMVQDAVLQRRASSDLAMQVVTALPTTMYAQCWTSIQRMVLGFEKAWEPIRIGTDEWETLRWLKLWLIRHAPLRPCDVAADLLRFGTALETALQTLDRRLLLLACQIAANYYNSKDADPFVPRITELFDSSPHWQGDISNGLICSETKSGFDWLCEMLHRSTCVILDDNTASYIAQSTTGEDWLLGFDLVCDHLDSLLKRLDANTSEIFFFSGLIRDMNSGKAVLLRRKAQAYLKEADCVMTGAKTTGSTTLCE